MVRRRRFGNEQYVEDSTKRSSASSLKREAALKKQGYRVKVTKGKSDGKAHYTIWKTKKPLFLYNYKGYSHPAIPHRLKLSGKWFQHYHPDVTHEDGVTKSLAKVQAERLRKRGYNARIKKVYSIATGGGYAVYHRRR